MIFNLCKPQILVNHPQIVLIFLKFLFISVEQHKQDVYQLQKIITIIIVSVCTYIVRFTFFFAVMMDSEMFD